MQGLLLVTWLAIAPVNAPAADPADVAAQKSIAERNFPWFDAEKQDFRPVSFPWRMSRRRTENSSNLSMDSGSSSNSGMSLVFLYGFRILLFTTAVVVLVYLLYLLFQSMELQADIAEVKHETPELDSINLDALPAAVRNVTDFLGEAQRLAASGDFSLAMVFYYSWQLVTLNKAQILELEVGKTNRQYMRETSQNCPQLRELFMKSTRTFEETFYGSVLLQSDAFRELWQHRSEFSAASARRPQ
jgi:hypothetical protein